MDLGFCLGVALLLSVWSNGKSADIPKDVLYMECHDRYFMIAVDLSFTGNESRFEAVDRTGTYTITQQYAAECGYKVSVYPLPPLVELRASYFSCHTDNQDDQIFTFNFNLITTHEGKEVTYALNKTCSPSSPWAPREVICEANYMEVIVRTDTTCPSRTKKDDWNTTTKAAYALADSDWQVFFQKEEQQLTPITLSQARKQRYLFDLTDGRLVFRTPYGQPDSFSTMVNNVPVEVIHPTLFSRHSWVFMMIDLVAACSMHEGSYDGSYLHWEAPQGQYLLPSGLKSMQVSVGLNDEVWEQPAAQERGYIVETHQATTHVGIPYNAPGVFRKSFVSDRLSEFYIFDFYLEQTLVDRDHVDTKIYSHRVLTTLLPGSIFTDNRTVIEEETFTVYLGVPEDMELVSFQLNGQEFKMPFTNTSTYTISEVSEPSFPHGYTLKVPFDDPVVIRQFSKEDAVLQYRLHINYTLAVVPEQLPYHYTTLVTAVITGVSPPAFDVVCSERGIRFRMDRQPFDHLWKIGIGSEPLTQELAEQLGYFMHSDNQSMLLDVPLFTYGFVYNDIGLERFFGTFKLLVWDRKMTQVYASYAKTCTFTTDELIVCSTDGKLTVVADVSVAIPSGRIPVGMTLRDKSCGPIEMNGTRVLFSFRLNTCGTKVKLGRGNVIYENEILVSQTSLAGTQSVISSSKIDKVTVQCTYPLAGLHRLFSVYRFESDTDGFGSINSVYLTAAAQNPAMKPTTASTITTAPTRKPDRRLPVFRLSPQYIELLNLFKNFLNTMRKRR